ncbi:MAG: AGE family epimerase/isomerase [Parvularculaceae bacterium]|nr:AGE family epimerase/isomerase [Parvularculaceae bacterium]
MTTRSSVDAALAEAQTSVKRWLFEDAFPFWSEAGPDPRGGFRERLALNGSPIADPTSRVRVQARQTVVFSHARALGWEPATSVGHVARGAEILLRGCRRADGLFGKIMAAGGGLASDEPDLYDNAFCLLALAHAARTLADPRLLDVADVVLAALDGTLGHPRGGYQESLPPRLPRRQNPHMHLFEALLALAAVDPSRDYLARAATLAALFERRFVDRSTSALVEYFDDGWTPLAGHVEPGHHFEWSWLLGEHARATRRPPSPTQRALYTAALPFLDAEGQAPQTAMIGGGAVDATRRAWTQTETLKAHVAMSDDRAALTTLAGLVRHHLAGAPAGAWLDHVAADGALLATDIPASTGYHIVLAFDVFLNAPRPER